MEVDAKIIPLQSVPSQRLKVILDGQQCEIYLYARDPWGHIYADIIVNGVVVIDGAPCLHDSPVPSYAVRSFSGRLIFRDTSGKKESTEYPGLGTRWECFYVTDDALKQAAAEALRASSPMASVPPHLWRPRE